MAATTYALFHKSYYFSTLFSRRRLIISICTSFYFWEPSSSRKKVFSKRSTSPHRKSHLPFKNCHLEIWHVLKPSPPSFHPPHFFLFFQNSGDIWREILDKLLRYSCNSRSDLFIENFF